MINSINAVNSDKTMAVAASALKAQQARMRIIAENLANSDSTATTKGGDPYRRQLSVFTTSNIDGATGVKLAQVVPDQTAFTQEYDPTNPAADASGNVKRPNVDPLTETMDMRDAQRAYEANLNVVDTARDMIEKTLDILNK
jgi:flagellar basal-body rod protein FlgC